MFVKKQKMETSFATVVIWRKYRAEHVERSDFLNLSFSTFRSLELAKLLFRVCRTACCGLFGHTGYDNKQILDCISRKGRHHVSHGFR